MKNEHLPRDLESQILGLRSYDYDFTNESGKNYKGTSYYVQIAYKSSDTEGYRVSELKLPKYKDVSDVSAYIGKSAVVNTYIERNGQITNVYLADIKPV